MARDFNGSSDRIDYSNVLSLYNSPLTISCWVNGDAFAKECIILETHTSGDSGSSVRFAVHSAAWPLFNIYGASTFVRISATTIPTGSDRNIIVTHDGSTTAANSHIYVNGSEGSYIATNNGASPTADTGSWSVGGHKYDDSNNWDGRISNLGVWNRILGADEISALAKGYSPLFFRRGLRFAPDLVSHPRDPISNQAGTLDGTSVSNANPRIIWPRTVQRIRKTTAAPAAGGGPIFGGRAFGRGRILGGSAFR